MHTALSQNLNNLELMSSIKPSLETSPAQKSSTIPLISLSSSSRRVSEKHSLEVQEDATMDSKTVHETVPLTSNKGEVLLLSPTAAQAQQARANVKREYKHSQGTHKTRTISGKGSKSGKQGKGKPSKATKSASKSKGKSAQGKSKAAKSGKKSTSAGKSKKKNSAGKKSSRKVTSKKKGKAKKTGKSASKTRK